MASSSKIMHGARAQIIINNVTIGIFTNCSYGSAYDVQPAFVLGRYSPAELAYTSAEPIGITCSGWRVVDHGPYAESAMPKLQDLMTAEDITISIYDRQTGKRIMTVVGCKHAGFNTSVAPKTLEDATMNYVGLRLSDETADNNEAAGASALPQ